MKTKVVISVILFVFSFLVSLAQEQTIKLNLEEGFEYIYDLTENNYVQTPTGENDNSKVQKEKLKIIVEKVEPGVSVQLRVNIVENYKENNYGTRRQRTDYVYLDFRDIGFLSKLDAESFFSSTDLIFQVDLVNRKIELSNRAELLEFYHELLIEKNSDDIEKKVEIFNKVYLKNVTGLVDFILWFHDTHILDSGKIKNSVLEDQLILKEKAGKQFDFRNNTQSSIRPGVPYKYFSINIENGLLQDYKFIQKDSIKNKYGQNVGEYLYNVSEQNYKLLSKRKLREGPVVISGKIRNPLSNKLYLRYLDEPFGMKFKKRTVYLSDSGYFSTNIDLKHAGFIFIENQNPNRNKSSESYILYAEQADSIVFYHDLKSHNKPMEIAGTRVAENILLNNINSNYGIFNSGEYFDRWDQIFYDPRHFDGIFQGDVKMISERINDLMAEYEKVNQQLKETEKDLRGISYQFINNEIKSYYYGLAFQYLSVGAAYEKDQQVISKIPKTIQNEIKINDLNSYFNDYGFYSRNCVSKYARYKFLSYSQINNPGYAFKGYLVHDISLYIQFLRMILTGAPLYREIAALLENSFTEIIYVPWQSYEGHITNEVVDYLHLIATNCFDKEIVNKVLGILNQYEELKNNKFEIKELTVYDENLKKLQLKDIIQESKPTVVLFATDFRMWILSMERDAKENPDINFIRIAQASNPREWIEYNQLAEPEIPSFLYLNDSISLLDIFLKTKVLAVFDKQGELINYKSDIKSAIKLAKENLTEKKELDKSQLQIIIVILLLILLAFIIVILFWKWRVRQQFRKEEQLRRLRELELTAIRSQMNPHFLFNCLNSVQNLVQQNKGREAHLYLSDFAGLIRKVLQNSEKEEASLAEELEMTKQYLNLEKLRFDFEFSINVEESIDSNNTMVPSMLLQPFAENAVVHGLQNKPDNRSLKIDVKKAAKEENGIVICIEDNGIGRKAAGEMYNQKNGKSSKLVQERLDILQQKQGEKYVLRIVDLISEGMGTRVEIFISEEV